MYKKATICLVLLFFNVLAQNTLFQQENSENLYNQAIELLFLNKYSASYEKFNEYIQKYPSETKSIDAQYYSAFCAMQLNHKSAITQIQNFANKYPEHQKAILANFDIGTHYFKQKNYEKAVYCLSKVDLNTLDDENKLECNFRLAYSYLNLKNFEKASSVFLRLKSDKNKYQYAANYYLGFIYYKQEKHDFAETHLIKAAENEAFNTSVPPLLANCYLKQAKYDTVLAYSERILAKNESKKGLEDLYLLSAEACYHLQLWEKAIENFNNYFATNLPVSELTKFRYGVCKYKTEDYDKAIQTLTKTAEKNDTIGQNSAYYLGLTWLRLLNKPFAFNAFNQARKMKFNKNISHQSALEYVKIGLELAKFQEVISACREYINHNEDGGIFYNEINEILSEAYLHTNDFAIAIKHIEGLKFKGGNINKTYQLVTHFYGLELYNQEKYSEAIEVLEKSKSNDFDRETTVLNHYYLGECLTMVKRNDDAIEYYKKVIRHTAKIKPELFARSFYAMGYIYFNKNDYSKALIYFKDYIDEAKNETNINILNDGYIRFADCLYAAKKINDAIKYYTIPIENRAAADIDYCLLQKGILLAAINKNEDAKVALNVILQNYPNSKYYDDALFNFGLIDFENTNYPSAVTAFTDIINANKSDIYVPLALQKRAIAMYNLKNYDLSAQDYQTLLNKYPNHKVTSSAVLGLQEALNQLGKSGQMDTLIAEYKSKNPNDANIEKVEFENAKTSYFDLKYQEAISKFIKFNTEHPQSNYIYDAKYFLADAYAKTNDKINAKTFFEEVYQSQKGNFQNKTIQRLAEINFDIKEYEMSLKYYKNLSLVASNKKELAQSFSGLMQNFYELNKHDSSEFYANAILKNGAPSVIMQNKSLLYIAKNALADDKENAIDALISCFNQASDVSGAEAAYLLAQELFDNKSYKNSLDILFALNSKYSNFGKWIDKSYMLIADNYIKTNELYQAKATLISIVEKAKDIEISNQARQKLEKLEDI